MRALTNKELMEIDGGAVFSASLLNAASRAISTLMELGRNLGSAIIRVIYGSTCKV